MSDYIVKLIPKNPFTIMCDNDIQKIEHWLKKEISASHIDIREYDNPQFVDCGNNLEHISCPLCSSDISFEWWGEQMGALYVDNGFKTLLIKTPCCHKNMSLNDLCYNYPCGFSCIEFDIYNPVEDIKDSFSKKFKDYSGIDVRIIRCHL